VSFFGRPYLGSERVLPSQISAQTTECPGLANAQYSGDGGPTTIFNNKSSNIGPKYGISWLITLGSVRIYPHQTFPHDVPRGVYDNLDTIGPRP